MEIEKEECRLRTMGKLTNYIGLLHCSPPKTSPCLSDTYLSIVNPMKIPHNSSLIIPLVEYLASNLQQTGEHHLFLKCRVGSFGRFDDVTYFISQTHSNVLLSIYILPTVRFSRLQPLLTLLLPLYTFLHWQYIIKEQGNTNNYHWHNFSFWRCLSANFYFIFSSFFKCFDLNTSPTVFLFVDFPNSAFLYWCSFFP